jgi:hypothetical protein
MNPVSISNLIVLLGSTYTMPSKYEALKDGNLFKDGLNNNVVRVGEDNRVV